MRRKSLHVRCRTIKRKLGPLALVSVVLLLCAGCFETASLPVSAGIGPDPVLPPPRGGLVPTVNLAKARGWPDGARPVAAPGARVYAYARELDHPRWLLVLPNGDVLVAEANAPEQYLGGGMKKWLVTKAKRIVGAGGASADRITLLRDADGDGHVDLRTIFLQGLRSPFGMALIGNDFYVANTDALLRFPYSPGATSITAPGSVIVALPAGPINTHWTRNILPSRDGSELFVTVGSNSDHGENGMASEEGRAAIWLVDPASGRHRLFATGLRNPNGLAIEPHTGTLWTSVNERDGLGSDLVPDFMTAVRDGGFYGWPYSYFGGHLDQRVQPQRPDLVARAIVPDYALGAHTSSLGLVYSGDNALPPPLQNGMFIGQHGSWNRRPHSGYRVIFVPFAQGRPRGAPLDVLTGFLSEQGQAYGRPVGLAIDGQGALLVADDAGNVVWRVVAGQ